MRSCAPSVDAVVHPGKRPAPQSRSVPAAVAPESAGPQRRLAADDGDALPLLLAAVRHGGDRGRPPGDARPAGLPDQPRRAVLEGLVVHRAARPPRAAPPPAGPRRARRPDQPPGRGHLGRRPRPGGRRHRAHPARARPRRRRLLRRRIADQRAGLPVRQVRPRRPAHQRHRLQRPVLHELGRRCGQPRLRPRPRDAVPAQRHRRGRRRRAGRLQPRRHDAAGHAVVRRRPRARRAAHRRRPPAHRHRPHGRPPPAAAARHRPGAGQRAAAHRDRRGPGRRGRTSPRAPPASTTSGTASPPTGPTASSGSPACRSSDQRRTVFALARAEKAIVLTARGAEQHRSGTDTAQAWINLALALGLPGRPGQRLGHRHRPGQRAGRPRARAEGRPAARLPLAGRPGRPRARRRRLGRRPRRPADAGESAFELLDALGTDGGVRTLLVLASQRRGERSGRPPGHQPAARPGLPRWSATSSSPRPRSSPTSSCPAPCGRRRTAR